MEIEKRPNINKSMYSTISSERGLAVDGETGRLVNLDDDGTPIVEYPPFPEPSIPNREVDKTDSGML